ncbi:MAG: 3-deoxy-manno-octulosonate-8-phosphatase KdsC [Gammaproteobacteria bacterium]|nr:3-deoxy-manno-octulosonate-8-phosphatase KdsC [Gammaproteobacteria bacterium]
MDFNNIALENAKSIKLLILDVDGVLTDGGLYFDDNGGELKRFNALDGHGIKMLMDAGIEVGIISARNSKPVAHRLEGLGIKHHYQGQTNKVVAFEALLKTLCLDSTQVAYVGDDVIDLPVMSKVALPIAVANAHTFVKEHAVLTTKNTGGNGAVREVCDYLLVSQNKYDDLMASYLE